VLRCGLEHGSLESGDGSMSLATVTGGAMPKGWRRAPYRDQVLMALMGLGCSDTLTDKEEAKIVRVARFLDARECAEEIRDARDGSR
jgi:hypothetical protein